MFFLLVWGVNLHAGILVQFTVFLFAISKAYSSLFANSQQNQVVFLLTKHYNMFDCAFHSEKEEDYPELQQLDYMIRSRLVGTV